MRASHAALTVQFTVTTHLAYLRVYTPPPPPPPPPARAILSTGAPQALSVSYLPPPRPAAAPCGLSTGSTGSSSRPRPPRR
jgi:hypothetical protein